MSRRHLQNPRVLLGSVAVLWVLALCPRAHATDGANTEGTVDGGVVAAADDEEEDVETEYEDEDKQTEGEEEAET